ncbi:hypothetical protein OKW43_005763 [Paraburkholderia sp. WC7.3g]
MAQKSFALSPLSQAAQSCFGKDVWPDDIPVPQAWLESAERQGNSRGHVAARTATSNSGPSGSRQNGQ